MHPNKLYAYLVYYTVHAEQSTAQHCFHCTVHYVRHATYNISDETSHFRGQIPLMFITVQYITTVLRQVYTICSIYSYAMHTRYTLFYTVPKIIRTNALKPSLSQLEQMKRCSILYCTVYSINISGFSLHFSGFCLHISGFDFHISGFCLHISGFSLHIFGFCLHISGFCLHISDTEPYGRICTIAPHVTGSVFTHRSDYFWASVHVFNLMTWSFDVFEFDDLLQQLINNMLENNFSIWYCCNQNKFQF